MNNSESFVTGFVKAAVQAGWSDNQIHLGLNKIADGLTPGGTQIPPLSGVQQQQQMQQNFPNQQQTPTPQTQQLGGMQQPQQPQQFPMPPKTMAPVPSAVQPSIPQGAGPETAGGMNGLPAWVQQLGIGAPNVNVQPGMPSRGGGVNMPNVK